MAHRRGQYQEMSYAGHAGAVPRLAILELVIRVPAISQTQSSPTASGKGSRAHFPSGRMEVSRDSSERQRPPMPHRAPGSTQDCFGCCLVLICLCCFIFRVSSHNHNLTLLTSPQWSSPSIRKGSHRGISVECSQQETPCPGINQGFFFKKIINFQSISTWISRTSHFLTPEQPRKATRGLSAAEKSSNGNN